MEKAEKPKRFRRTKADIEKGIIQAAAKVILAKGFAKATVLDIIKQEKIEPVTFYLRYRNQEDFYNFFTQKYDYWLQDSLGESQSEAYTEDRFTKLLKTLLNTLKNESIILELLRWEATEANDITRRTAYTREQTTIPLVKGYERIFENTNLDIAAISSIMVAGIYFLNLHKKCAPFCGIDLTTDEGMQRINQAIDQMAHLLFQNTSSTDQEIRKRADSSPNADSSEQ